MAKPLPRHHCYTIEDLVGEGYLGLFRAQGRFNPDSGVKFETYAYPRIIGTMRDAIKRRCAEPYGILPERAPAPSQPSNEGFDAMLVGLNRREKLLLTLRYCAGLDMREIARAIGYSVRLIKQMHADLLNRLHERYLGSFPHR